MSTNDLASIVESARAAFGAAATPADLENAKAQFTGKSGRITELMKGLGALPVEEKKARGAAINRGMMRAWLSTATAARPSEHPISAFASS